MTIIVPPVAVTDAIESGQCFITRRIEFYESDGETLWLPSDDDDTMLRLIDGNVTVDSTRQERRGLDLTLLNNDNLLRPNPNGGFWYDKVIKCYRGISYTNPVSSPKVTIVEQASLYGSQRMQLALKSIGLTRTFINLSASTWTDADSDVIVSYTETDPTTKSDLLLGQYNAGRAVLTFSTGNTEAEVPLIGSGSASGAIVWGVEGVSTDTPIAGGWTDGASAGTATGYAVSAAAAGATPIAVWTNGTDPQMVTAILQTNSAGGRWINVQLPNPGTTYVKQFLSAAIQWLADYSSSGEWETQIGEFVIDNLSDENFPYQIKITARDYMKRMIDSKLSQDETFVAGTNVTDLIIALARNSGITNQINVPGMAATLSVDFAYTRNTPRADIAIEAAKGIGQQLYFNNQGILTMEPLPDPTTDATVQTFKTGSNGNLVKINRSTNDSNLKNHVVVYGAPDGDSIPFFGEAKNTDPSSPTRIAKIGDRYTDFQFDTVNSDADCVALARKFLKVSALETYELSYDSVVYPHLDANVVVQILDPKAYDFEPDKYLMDTLNIPMSLVPMSATGKRITLVGDAG